MKRFFVLFMTMVILLSFAACGKRTNSSSTSCWSCGKNVSKESSFCENCGAAIKDDKTEAESTNTETDEAMTNADDFTSSTEETQSTEKPTERTKARKPTHTHSYSTKVTSATCTKKGYTTYTCACGDTYKADYVNPSHNYVNNVCTNCGEANANYSAYQAEYTQLTADYNANVAELQSKIATSESNIEKSQQAINNARGSLASLSPSCPQWFLQQYINNWQAYGDTYAATQAANNAWTQQYNSQKSQLELAISTNTSKIQAEQANISMYNSTISNLTTQYNDNVAALKVEYGM